MTRTALVAIGGNALVLDGEPGSVPRQQERAAAFGDLIADLVVDGWTILVTHGNGPQVGYIMRRGELVRAEALGEGLPNLPLWLAVADSQGGIGHLLAIAVDNALARRGHAARAVTVVTHAEIDPADPALNEPTKPIGGAMAVDVARRRVAEEGWHVARSGPDTYRRVVASPRPLDVLEAEAVRVLLASGSVVIAGGGGGIPVVRDDAGWSGVDAVIDKDLTSALLARMAGIESLVLVTGVDEVSVDFGTDHQRPLGRVTTHELAEHLAAGQFPAGSMGPKVAAALEFVEAGGRHALITSLPRLREALAGQAGTHLVPGADQAPINTDHRGQEHSE